MFTSLWKYSLVQQRTWWGTEALNLEGKLKLHHPSVLYALNNGLVVIHYA
jgi:hypothetical protein